MTLRASNQMNGHYYEGAVVDERLSLVAVTSGQPELLDAKMPPCPEPKAVAAIMILEYLTGHVPPQDVAFRFILQVLNNLPDEHFFLSMDDVHTWIRANWK